MHNYSQNNNHWTIQEDDFIRKNYSRLSVSDIAIHLMRSPKATRSRIERLGIRLAHLKRNRQWSEDEIRILRENQKLSVEDLSKLIINRGYSAIYSKSRLLGIIKKERKGYHFDGYGRKMIYIRHGVCMPEHRHLVETALGRQLSPNEQVHHINCDKTDNRLGNLHLFPSASKHLNAHHSVEKLVKILIERKIIKFNTHTEEYELICHYETVRTDL